MGDPLLLATVESFVSRVNDDRPLLHGEGALFSRDAAFAKNAENVEGALVRLPHCRRLGHQPGWNPRNRLLAEISPEALGQLRVAVPRE